MQERNPKTIALNMGGTRGATNGITHDAYNFLTETLGQDFASRFVSAAPLIVEYMDTRLPEELEHYRTAVAVTDILTQRAFSNEVITPGKTTVGDVRFWFLQQVNNLGIGVWFQPDLRVQRQNQETGKTLQFLDVAEESTVIQRGDVIHIDCGVNYLGLSTDWQKMGYVLREGEKDVPEGLKKALANTNRLQDALFTHIKTGAKGFEVYDATMADMKNRRDRSDDLFALGRQSGPRTRRECRLSSSGSRRTAGATLPRRLLHLDRTEHDDSGSRVGRTESNDHDGRRRLPHERRNEMVPPTPNRFLS